MNTSHRIDRPQSHKVSVPRYRNRSSTHFSQNKNIHFSKRKLPRLLVDAQMKTPVNHRWRTPKERNRLRSSSITVAILQETFLLAPRTKALGLITLLRIQETCSAALLSKQGTEPLAVPLISKRFALESTKPSQPFPAAEIHGAAESKAEFAIATATRVLSQCRSSPSQELRLYILQ